jgi:FMN-dependent NADH-azoreductase
MLGLDLRVIVPELTHAPMVPAMAGLVPLHEAAMTEAHRQAVQQGECLSRLLAA